MNEDNTSTENEENPLVAPTEGESPVEVQPQEPEQPAEPNAPKRDSWFMKEIAALREEKRELKERLETLAKQPQTAANADKVESLTLTEEEINRRIDELAEQKANIKAATQTFARACNNVYSAGEKEYSNFKDAVESLNQIGVLSSDGQPTAILSAVVELNNGHKVLHYLAENPDVATTLKNYTPLKQAIEVANIANKLSAPAPQKPVSTATPPIKPISAIGGKPAPNLYDTDTPIDEWMKLNAKHEEERYKSRYS